jgi:hypothetical protein
MSDPPQGVMNKLEHFEIMEDYAVFRSTGQVSLEQATKLVSSAIAFACEHQIRKLLVVTINLTGFEPPDIATRYFFHRDWAHAAQGRVCVALVARPEIFDFEKIGVIIDETAGFQCDGFTSEDEALAWLKRVKWVSQEEKIRLHSRVTSPTRRA